MICSNLKLTKNLHFTSKKLLKIDNLKERHPTLARVKKKSLEIAVPGKGKSIYHRFKNTKNIKLFIFLHLPTIGNKYSDSLQK
jgi:hypothetical protein